MATIYTVEGNTSGGSTLVANGGGVAKKSYPSNYGRIACIWRPQYKSDEALKVVQEALKWVGYLEKKSNAKLESFTNNAGTNNYNIFAKHAAVETGAKGIYVNGVAWCDIFVDDMLIRALGVQRTKELIKDWSAYTPTSSNYLSAAGAKKISNFADAKYGDIIFFKNSSGGICHVGIVITGAEDEIKVPKKETAAKTYNQKQFIKDVCKILKVKNAKQALNKTKTLSKSKNKNHALVLPVQKYLKSLGYYEGVCDKDFGTLTEKAVNKYQTKILKYSCGDGEITAKNTMWKKMLGLK